jgi:hypothetical protein
VAARQFLGVAAISLDAVSRLGWNQVRRDDLAGNPSCVSCQESTYPVLDRPELVNQFANRFQAIGDYPERANIPARFGPGHGNGFCVDIETHEE